MLHVRHGVGAALVDLGGMWQADADIDFQIAFGEGRLRLPSDVRIEGLDQPFGGMAVQEVPPPTLRINAHFDVGNIRIND